MRLLVHLIPKASCNKIVGWGQDVQGRKVLYAKVTAVPEDGKANDALIKLLGKTFHIPKSSISLVRGTTSRHKELEITEEIDVSLIPEK